MDDEEMKALIKVLTRIEKKLDTVIRAMYEHDENIYDDYGRSQRSIETGRRREADDQAGDLLGECDESSPSREQPGVPIANRSPIGEANPARGNGKVQREESIPRGNGKNKNVPRENGVSKHASSKSNASRQHHSRGGGQRGFNGNTQGSNR
jgi:hypothetical protein